MINLKTVDGIPVLPAFHDADNAIAHVWCPWCVTWHTHGWRLTHGRFQQRVAHCHTGPFDDRGYYFEVVGEWTPAVRRSVRTATSSQRWTIHDGQTTQAIERKRQQRPEWLLAAA